MLYLTYIDATVYIHVPICLVTKTVQKYIQMYKGLHKQKEKNKQLTRNARCFIPATWFESATAQG